MPGLTLEFVGRGHEASVGTGQQLAMPSILFHTSADWGGSSTWQEHYVDAMFAEKERGMPFASTGEHLEDPGSCLSTML